MASAVSTRPAPPHDEYRPDRARWMALGVCLAAGFMTLLDVSIVNVALPSIEQGLHAQPNELEWIVAPQKPTKPRLSSRPRPAPGPRATELKAQYAGA